MKIRALLAAVVAAAALSGGAQPNAKPTLAFRPLACVKARERAVLQVNVQGKGELVAYFRRVNTTDWCSVKGTTEGLLSRVVLPQFERGEEIEYFFVLLDGRRVVARSGQLYRSQVNSDCESPFARHVTMLLLNCSPDQSAIPSSFVAGHSLTADPEWPDFSPFEPAEQ